MGSERKENAATFRFQCSRCGEEHAGPPTFGFSFPIDYMDAPASERDTRVFLTSDTCVIDDERFFVRGVIQIPVHGADTPFAWGVWVKVSEKDFDRFEALLGVASRSHELPLTGLLSSPPRPYPDSTHLVAVLHLRDDGIRPFVTLEDTGHPLAVEQRQGITTARLAEIVELMVHRRKQGGLTRVAPDGRWCDHERPLVNAGR